MFRCACMPEKVTFASLVQVEGIAALQRGVGSRNRRSYWRAKWGFLGVYGGIRGTCDASKECYRMRIALESSNSYELVAEKPRSTERQSIGKRKHQFSSRGYLLGT